MKWKLTHVIGLFLLSLFVGVIIVSLSFGTNVTALNTVMAPLVCPGERIIPAWAYEGELAVNGSALQARWICLDTISGEGHMAGYRTILIAGTFYALLITGMVRLGATLTAAWDTRRKFA